MLFQLLSTGSMLGVWLSSHYFNTNYSNDCDKILKISDSSGLSKKDERIRIYRRKKIKNKEGVTIGTEFVFKIPLGLEFEDFKKQYGKFKDGLNNRSAFRIELKQFLELKFDKTIVKQIHEILSNRVQFNKEIEMDYDGMLILRVFDQGLQKRYDLTQKIIEDSKGWKIPIGETLNNQIIHDFEEAPHILIGGATDKGKSNLLNVIITILLHNKPNDVEFTLIDLKGGLEFSPYEHIKQTKNFATNSTEAFTALSKIQDELNESFETLREKGKKKVSDAGIKKRHFVIIDEAAELSLDGEKDPDIKKIKIQCENIIKDIARRGRASGLRLIYATQYPTTETIPSQVKRNLMTRICMRVDTGIASNVVLDEGGAEKLEDVKGRAIYKKTSCETFQTYLISDDLINQIIDPLKVKEKKENALKKTPTTTKGRTYTTDFEEIRLLNNNTTNVNTQPKKREKYKTSFTSNER